MRLPRLQMSFTVTLLTAFALVFALGMAAVLTAFRSVGQEVALATADRELATAAELVAARGRAMFRPLLLATGGLARFRPMAEAGPPDPAALAAFLDLLDAEPAVQAISVGRADGGLRQVLRVAALAPHPALADGVPAGARSILREAAPGQGEAWTFLDAARAVVARNSLATEAPDARGTPWFRQARAPGAVQVSPLIDLPLLGRPGLSFSNALAGGGVLALDITLEGLSHFLAAQEVSPGATLFLMDADGLLLAHQDPAQAVQRLPGGGTTWLALPSATDPLLRGFWDAYASGRLAPARTATLDLGGVPTLIRIEPIADIAGPPLLAVVIAPLEDFTAAVLAGVRRGTVLGGIALLLGLAGIGLLAWRVAIPLGRLTREAEAIRKFELDSPLRLDSHIAEVQRLGGAMAAMKTALINFGAYVPRDLVRQLISTGEMAVLGGDRRPLTVMFTDVEGFTDLAEALEPEEVMRLTSLYFDAMTQRLLSDGATIDKYIGDAIMALWNAPRRDAQHATHACLGALHARAVSNRLEEEFAARGWPRLRTRIGLHTGEAVVGNVGSSDRLSYTAIGTMVNLASRLEGLNKYYGTRIMISEATRDAAGDGFLCRSVDLIMPKGAQRPLEVFELVGMAAPGEDEIGVPADIREGLPGWAAATAAYRAGEFAAAAAHLEALPRGPAPDPLRERMAARIAALLAEPPAPGWSPVIRFDVK